MRCAYGALVLSSLVLQKDLSGDPDSRSTGDGAAQPWQGENKWAHVQNTFCFHPVLCWVFESPWGVHLAGTFVLLLWLWVETWAAACLAGLRAKPQETRTVCLPEPGPEVQREEDVRIPETGDSFCICGERLTSGVESYEPPCKRHGLSSFPDHITEARHPNENRPEHCRSPLLPCVVLRTLSTSPSPSSSSSSSSSSHCLTCLKHLDWQSSCGKFPATTEDSSRVAFDSLDESNSKTSYLYLEGDDPKLLKTEHEPSYIPLRPRRHPYLKRKLSDEKYQPVPSFAQINFIQSAAYKEEAGVILVEKSLEIRMGQVPPDVGRPDLPRFLLADQEESGERPKALALLDQIAHPPVDGNWKPGRPLEKSPIPKASPQIGHPRWDTVPRATSVLADFDPNAFVLDKMDKDILGFLEFHVKKKMVQRQCGVPTVIVRSLQHFQSLEDLRHMELEREHPRPVKRLMGTPIRARSPARPVFLPRNTRAVWAKPCQKPPGAKEYYILRPLESEEINRLVSGSAAKKPSIQTALFQGMREKYVLLSMQPDELRRIVFHITVKMLEIKQGTFPEVVEDSLWLFSLLSARPLPKAIRWGNKVPRPKHFALPFVPGEALCLIDLNIKHKYLVYTWKLPTPYTRSAGETTADPPQPSGAEGGNLKGQKPPGPGVPILILKKIAKGKAHPQASGQVLLTPGSQKPLGLPPAQLAIAGKAPELRAEKSPDMQAEKSPDTCAKKSPEVRAESSPEAHAQLFLDVPPEKRVHFIDIFSDKMFAQKVPPESANVPREPSVAATRQHIPPPGKSESGETQPERAAASEVRPLPLSTDGGTTRGEGMAPEEAAGVDWREAGGKEPREASLPSLEETAEPRQEGARGQEDRDRSGREPEGRSICTADPLEKEAEEAEGRAGPVAAGEFQQDRRPLLVDGTEEAVGQRKGAEAGQSSSEQTEREGSREGPSFDREGAEGEGTGTEGAGSPARQPERPEPCKVAFSADEEGIRTRKREEAGGRTPETQQAGKRPKEASIVRASLFLELELAKEKLNLHLKKKLDARLRPPQGARLDLDVDVGRAAGSRRERRATRHRHRGRPASRPFCYVCMPLDETGSVVKTVCWSLPRRILEMNGNRVPRVVRFESKTAAGR